jgi:tyrosyl-tRNA synthetase
MATPGLLDDLAARGVIANVTDRDGLAALLDKEAPVTLYAGYDPTSASLHIGNLVPTMLLYRFQQAGHRPIVLVGGATGMIGDPSGKSDERNLLDPETVERNIAGIRGELSKFLDFGPGPSGALMTNNYDWFKDIGYLEFLRVAGKHLTINYMMQKESVRARLEDRDSGISYTEFSYMFLQSWDFVKLHELHGCRLQVGGNDQYGNITAGCELARKAGKPQLYGLTAPLLLDSTGQKMGKTSTGERVWLSAERTSPYAFYQYWLNAPDDKAVELLRLFSFRPYAEVEDIVRAHGEDPARRGAQKELAAGMTKWVHGAEGVRRAEGASAVMFGGALTDLGDADLEPLVGEVGSIDLPASELAAGVSLVDLLVRAELCTSKGEARRAIGQGGIYVNNVKVDAVDAKLDDSHRGTPGFVVLRHGRKKYKLVRVV